MNQLESQVVLGPATSPTWKTHCFGYPLRCQLTEHRTYLLSRRPSGVIRTTRIDGLLALLAQRSPCRKQYSRPECLVSGLCWYTITEWAPSRNLTNPRLLGLPALSGSPTQRRLLGFRSEPNRCGQKYQSRYRPVCALAWCSSRQ